MSFKHILVDHDHMSGIRVEKLVTRLTGLADLFAFT